MSRLKLMIILGTRPQIIKSAPIIHEAEKDDEIELQLVHTGQHYDYEMSKIFFDELDLPSSLTNLEVGSGSHAWQTGEMMLRLEKTVVTCKPDVVMVPGDTNSTLAGALVAVKLQRPVAHVEAGARSYDLSMPEEVNRRLTDHCSRFLFAPTENCQYNLVKEGVPKERIFSVGDTMHDALLKHLPRAKKSRILDKLHLEAESYCLITAHRPENVDDRRKLKTIVSTMLRLSELQIVFPIHPRTRKNLEDLRLTEKLSAASNVKLIDPVSYHDNIKLMKSAKMIFTDSGGMQKEAFWLKTPCITLREKTEWPETVELGGNKLVGCSREKIIAAAKEYLFAEDVKNKLRRLPNPFADGKASEKIIKTLKALCIERI